MTCQNCGQYPATTIWVGEGGALAYVHGGGAHWCERCVVQAQLDHALQQADLVPVLQERLVKLGGKFVRPRTMGILNVGIS